jgi:general secretion pathway protein L
MKLGINNWRQYLRDVANRAGLPRFWRWWIGELAPLLPSASRVALQRRFARPVIELADDEAVFWRPDFGDGASRLVIAEKVSLSGDAAAVLAAGRAAVSHLAANASGGLAAPKVVVVLGSRQVLRKQFALPAAVEENLAQTLAYDLDRHTPFRPEQLYFDAVVVARDPAKKMLRVDWAAALRTIVDTARGQVESWGAVPVAIAPGPPTAPTRLNLIPEATRPRQLQWRRWQVWAPLAAVGLFAFAAVVVPLVQKRQYAIALIAMNAEAAQLAQAADKVRTQLESTQSDYNFILAKKYTYPSTVRVLDEVTRTLPDDTWLTQLELKTSGRGKDVQHDVYLRGESGNAGKLVALLEDTKLVEQAAPRSPTTKIQGAPGEIFDIGAHLRTLPLPAAEQVALNATPAPVAPVTPARPVAAPAVAAPAPAPAPAAAAPPAPANAAEAPPAASAPPAAMQRFVQPGRSTAPRMVPAPQQPGAVPPVAAPKAATTMPAEPTTDVPPAPTMPGAMPAPVPQAQPAKDDDE